MLFTILWAICGIVAYAIVKNGARIECEAAVREYNKVVYEYEREVDEERKRALASYMALCQLRKYDRVDELSYWMVGAGGLLSLFVVLVFSLIFQGSIGFCLIMPDECKR